MHGSPTKELNVGPRRLRPEKRSHILLSRADLVGARERHVFPLPHPNLHLHVWQKLHSAVALRQRSGSTTNKHPMVRRRPTPRGDYCQRILQHPCDHTLQSFHEDCERQRSTIQMTDRRRQHRLPSGSLGRDCCQAPRAGNVGMRTDDTSY